MRHGVRRRCWTRSWGSSGSCAGLASRWRRNGMNRTFDADRELLLLAYEQVTPPRSAVAKAARAKLLRTAREVLDATNREAMVSLEPPPARWSARDLAARQLKMF